MIQNFLNKNKLAIILIYFFSFSWNCLSAIATGDITSKVISAISITFNTNMSFGVGFSGDTARLSDVSEGGHEAIFLVNGEPGRSYSVSLPQEVTLTRTEGGGDTIVINNFYSTSNNLYIINSSGNDTLSLWGTRAALNQGQAPGNYTGQINVTINYN